MAIRRNRLDRKADLTLGAGHGVDMPPSWAFTIDCPHHGPIKFDFNPYRANGREDIASHMRDAIWSLRYEMVGNTLKSIYWDLQLFWHFLDDLQARGETIDRLVQIDRKILDRYLVWMETQVITKKGETRQGHPFSNGSKRKSFTSLKTLLINRQKRVRTETSTTLSFPRNPYPNSNKRYAKREPYSQGEQERITAALSSDLRSIHECNKNSLDFVQVLIVNLLVLAQTTGRNLQSLLDLERDSLREHPLEDRELLVTTKRRGWSSHATSVRKSDSKNHQAVIRSVPASVGDHFRHLCDFTASLAEKAAEKDKNLAFLWQISERERKGEVLPLSAARVAKALPAFTKRHNLIDDRGRPLRLIVARLRPTFATELFRRTRDIRSVQKALGHSNVETTARHYANAPFEAERDHAIVLDGMVSQFARMEIEGKVLVAADGKVPLQDVKALLSGGYNTGIARCKNPFRENESVCQKFFHCFKCPSMCVFEDDLWRLFSFYYRLLAERSKINPAHWLKTYGPIIRRIDADIASQFPADKVESARLNAQQTPHPTWKEPLL